MTTSSLKLLFSFQKPGLHLALSKRGKQLLLLFLVFIAGLPLHATNYTSIGNGDWSSPGSWSPAGIPGVNDNVIINGHSLQIAAGTSCRSLTFNTAAAPSELHLRDGISFAISQAITVNSPGGSFKNVFNIGNAQVITGSLVINGGSTQQIGMVQVEKGTLEIKGNLSFNNNATAKLLFSSSGTLQIGGVLGTNGNLDFGPAGVVVFNGVAAQTIPVGYVYQDILIENMAGVKLGGDLFSGSVLGSIGINKGNLNLNGFTLSGNGTNVLAVENGASIIVPANSGFPTGFNEVNLKAVSEVIYQGGNQAIAPLNYSRITLKGSGSTKTLSRSCSIASMLVLDAGVEFVMDTCQVTGIGAAIINGYVKTAQPNGLIGLKAAFNNSGGLTLGSASTVEYNMNGNQLITSRNDYKDLVISNGGEKTILGNITIKGKLTVEAGAVLNTAAFQVVGLKTPKGSIEINGTIRTSRPEGLSGSTRTAFHNFLGPIALGPGSTVEYNAAGSGVQVITSRSDYQHIVLTNNRMKALQGDITIAGKLLVSREALLSLDDFQVMEKAGSNAEVEVKGSVALTNPYGFSGSTTTAIHSNLTLLPLGIYSNIIYDAMGPQSVTALNYGGITINNMDVKTVLGDITVRNFLQIDQDATLDMESYQILYEQIAGIKPYIAINGTFRTSKSKGFCGRSHASIVTQFKDIWLNTNSTIVYYGFNQTVSGRNDYGNLVIESGQTKVLDGPAVINTSLDLAGGSLTIGDYSLTIEASAEIFNVSGASYIVQNGSGRLFQKNIGTDWDGKTGEVLFPIGTPLSYTPLYLTNNGPNNNFSALVTTGVTTDGVILNPDWAVDRTWDVNLETSNGVPDVNLRFQWNSGDENIQFDRTKAAVAQSGSASWTWITPFGQADGAEPFTVTANGLTTFSAFVVASNYAAQVLPVSLTYFRVNRTAEGAVLQWNTATEKNNKGFDIQLSADGRNFETVGFVASLNGNSSGSQTYEYRDLQGGKTGLWYYRLKQTDYDGMVAFYGPKVMDFGKLKEWGNVYPNPFREQFTLELSAASVGQVDLTLVDLTGKLVHRSQQELVKGQNLLPVRLSADYPAGIYLLTAKTGSQIYTTRLIKD